MSPLWTTIIPIS